MKLYENIKKRREALNMTQAELAELVGYSDKSMISRVENGLIDLSQTKIMAFAEALRTTPTALMGPVDEPDDYYVSPVVRAYAEKMANNPKYQVLFDAAANVPPEDIDLVTQLIERFSEHD